MAVWQTVRVFLSSTFRDMQAERNHLVKVVFPALRERLEPHRVHLIDIDLRWGVTREQAENDLAAELCLQQIDACRPFFLGFLGERYGWTPTSFPATTLAQFPWLKFHPGKSLTDLEMVYGVLAVPGAARRVFFYFRDPSSTASIPDPLRRDYIEAEPAQREKLAALKERIRRCRYPLLDGYPARWDDALLDRTRGGRGRLTELSELGERVLADLWSAIREELQLPDEPIAVRTDTAEEEDDHHERFLESRLRLYVGREEPQNALLAHVDGDADGPCLVTGPSGSGKSSLLARLVVACRQRLPNALVVPHFVGAGPRSTSSYDLLGRLCRRLDEEFGPTGELPEELSQRVVAFRERLERIPNDRRLVLVIDCLNQMDEALASRRWAWLPSRLPAHVRIVVSHITDPERESSNLEELRQVCRHEVAVGPLRESERREIVRLVPSLSAKTLDEQQVTLLLENPATANPLFLLVALEELRGFGSFEQLNARLTALPRTGDPVTALFDQVLARLEEEFGLELAELVLVLLASARRGLSERELLELTAAAKLVSGEELFPLLRQLRPYLLRRGSLIDFYHGNLRKAVQRRYLADEEVRRTAHACLAEYFNSRSAWLGSSKPRVANVRRADELLWQRVQAGQFDEAAELLISLEYLEAKTEAGQVAELVSEFVTTTAGLPESHPLRQRLPLLGAAVRRDLHFLTRHPTTLFQCLWNSCWWHDSPRAARYFETGSPSPSGAELHRSLEQWRTTKKRQQPDFCWVRSLTPGAMPLDAPQIHVWRIHRGTVEAVAFSPDGRWFASADGMGMVVLWDAASETEVRRLKGPYSTAEALAFSPDGKRLVSAWHDTRIRVWTVPDGELLHTLEGHDKEVHTVAFVPGTTQFISGSEAGDLRIWDVEQGSEVRHVAATGSEVLDVAPSPDGRSLASSHEDGRIRLWDLATLAPLGELLGHEKHVASLAFSPDGRQLVSGSGDGTVRLWDVASRTCRLELRGHADWVQGVDFSPDGRWVCSGSWDHTVRIWDVQHGEPVRCFTGTEGNVWCVQFSPDGRRVVSGGGDQCVRFWDLQSPIIERRRRGHTLEIHALAVSADGRWVVTGGLDGTVRFWRFRDGREVGEPLTLAANVTGLALTADGRLLAVATADHKMRLFAFDSRAEVGGWDLTDDEVYRLTFSADGRRLAAGAGERGLRVWDVDAGQLLWQIQLDEGQTVVPAFSPDGTRLATVSHGSLKLREWDAASGAPLQTGTLTWEDWTDALYTPDGRCLLTQGHQASVAWDLEHFRSRQHLAGDGDLKCDASIWDFPVRPYSQELDLVLENAFRRRPLAWFPMRLFWLRAHPRLPQWVGFRGDQLFFVRLEGGRRFLHRVRRRHRRLKRQLARLTARRERLGREATASLHVAMGRVLLALRRPAEAIQTFRDAVAKHEAQLAQGVETARKHLARTHRLLADARIDYGDTDEACEEYRHSLRRYAECERDEFSEQLIAWYNALLAFRRHRPTEASELVRSAAVWLYSVEMASLEELDEEDVQNWNDLKQLIARLSTAATTTTPTSSHQSPGRP